MNDFIWNLGQIIPFFRACKMGVLIIIVFTLKTVTQPLGPSNLNIWWSIAHYHIVTIKFVEIRYVSSGNEVCADVLVRGNNKGNTEELVWQWHFSLFKSQTPLINFSKACEERRVELQALLVDAHVLWLQHSFPQRLFAAAAACCCSQWRGSRDVWL